MKSPHIQLNLASEPFRRDRPILLGSAVTAALLAVVLAMLVSFIVSQRNAARETRAAIARAEGEQRQVNREQAQLEGILRQPENEVVLERSIFLNGLLHRKGISWTRLFGDLEKVFPHDVRLVSVRPFVTPDDRLQLDMVVGAQAPEPVIHLLRKLEASVLFGGTALQGWMPPSQNEPLYRYRVSVNYAQQL
jgi:hypothetical protein